MQEHLKPVFRRITTSKDSFVCPYLCMCNVYVMPDMGVSSLSASSEQIKEWRKSYWSMKIPSHEVYQSIDVFWQVPSTIVWGDSGIGTGLTFTWNPYSPILIPKCKTKSLMSDRVKHTVAPLSPSCDLCHTPPWMATANPSDRFLMNLNYWF